MKLAALFLAATAVAVPLGRAAQEGVAAPLGYFYGVAPVGPVSIQGREEVVIAVAHGARQVTPTLIQADGAWACAVDISPERKGEIVWRRRLDAAVWAEPTLAVLSGRQTLLVSTVEELLFLDVERGEVMRRISPPPAYRFDDRFTPVVADLDGDGRAEVVAALVAETYSESAALAILDGEGAIWCPPIVLDVQFATGVAVADVNRDGSLDLVVAGNYDGLGEVDVLSLRDRRRPRLLWYRLLDGQTATPPAVVGDRVYASYSITRYCCGGVQLVTGNVEALDFRGRLTASFEFDGSVAAFQVDGDRMAVRTSGYFAPDASRQFVDGLYQLEEDGRSTPGFPIEARGLGGHRVTMVDGMFFQPVSGAYVANPAGIYAFSSENGEEAARYLVGRAAWTTDPVVTDELVISVSVGEQSPWRATLHIVPR